MGESRMVYRIEDPVEMNGMWYTKDGLFRQQIHVLCPNGIAKDFPMPLNLELHRKDGRVWNSAGKSADNMNQWFTAEDARNLHNHGFKLFEFEVTLYQELPMEILFCREGIVSQREIPLEEIWSFHD